MFQNILKNFWEYNPEKDVEETGEKLVKFILDSAYSVFCDGQFRKNFDFKKMTKGQKDKIYNELSIAGLCFLMFYIEDLSEIRTEETHFWQGVKEKIPIIFKKWLKELKIGEKSINYWDKLLNRRYEDYRLCQRDYRLKLESIDKNFAKSRNDILKNDFVRFQALSFGSMYHIRGGKIKNNDSISKYLKTWLATLNKQIIKKI
jgi:hypothetical protein